MRPARFEDDQLIMDLVTQENSDSDSEEPEERLDRSLSRINQVEPKWVCLRQSSGEIAPSEEHLNKPRNAKLQIQKLFELRDPMTKLYDDIILDTARFYADSGDIVTAAHILLVFYYRFHKQKSEHYIQRVICSYYDFLQQR